MRDRLICLAVAMGSFATTANAAVTLSSAATANMTCSGGVCAPTAKNAVLNVGDLETLLASGSVTVTTTGTGVQANDIDVKSALSWSSSGALSLLANKSITVDNPVSVTGLGGLAITTGKKGTFSFGKKGNVTFANLPSPLSINGAAYTLVGDLETLSSDIAASPSGDFALASNYDASGNGSVSVSTTFTGTFEGLGNVISNFVPDTRRGNRRDNVVNVGLFEEVGASGVVRDIGLTNVSLTFVKQKGVKEILFVGTLVGYNSGTVLSSYATGTITDYAGADDGGLVSQNYGTIINSHAAVAIVGTTKKGSTNVGGLVQLNGGIISSCYATGAVSGIAGGGLVSYGIDGSTIADSYATGDVQIGSKSEVVSRGGGLVGLSAGAISNSYATGNVQSGAPAVNGSISLGGLVGENDSTISLAYSTGAVAGGTGSIMGGLVGTDSSQPGSITDTYWDTETSGQSQGAGNVANDPGITGLTTAQFQSGLPTGFDPTIWNENPNVLDGFPYLLANKPVK